MSLIARTIPINIQAEKERFFADPTYNPQFVYEEAVSAEDLVKHGTPIGKYVDLAKEILDKSYFGRNEEDLWMLEGKVVSQNDVTKNIITFLKMHGLEKRFEVIWSSSFLPRAAMTTEAIKLRLPPDFRHQGMMGMIYHEIGTHALRRINYEQQPWFKKKTTFGFRNYLITEEGLAVLHALIPHTNKSLFISAIRYLAVAYGQEHSFAETWDFLGKYVQDPERRWLIAYRSKRGVTDTSKAGGFTKDLTYLQGPIEVWQWLKKRDFDVTPLYFGKVAWEDVEKAVQLNPDFKPLLPVFFTKNRDHYATELQAAGEYNFLDQV